MGKTKMSDQSTSTSGDAGISRGTTRRRRGRKSKHAGHVARPPVRDGLANGQAASAATLDAMLSDPTVAIVFTDEQWAAWAAERTWQYEIRPERIDNEALNWERYFWRQDYWRHR